MIEKKDVYLTIHSMDEYSSREPQRLDQNQLQAEQLYTLMMRVQGNREQTVSASIFLHQVQHNLAATSIDLVFTNEHYEPLDYSLPSYVTHDRYWSPAGYPLSVQTRQPPHLIRLGRGYFTEHDDGVGELPELEEGIELSSLRRPVNHPISEESKI